MRPQLQLYDAVTVSQRGSVGGPARASPQITSTTWCEASRHPCRPSPEMSIAGANRCRRDPGGQTAAGWVSGGVFLEGGLVVTAVSFRSASVVTRIYGNWRRRCTGGRRKCRRIVPPLCPRTFYDYIARLSCRTQPRLSRITGSPREFAPVPPGPTLYPTLHYTIISESNETSSHVVLCNWLMRNYFTILADDAFK